MHTTLRSSVTAIALAFLAVLAFSSAAGAQEGNGAYVGGEVKSNTELNSSPAPGAQANSAEVNSAEANSLAFTGSDATTIALIGAVAVLAGGSILVLRRRSAAL